VWKNNIKYLFLGVFCFVKGCCCFYSEPTPPPRAQPDATNLEQSDIFTTTRPAEQIAIFPVVKNELWLQYAQSCIWNYKETFKSGARVILPPDTDKKCAARQFEKLCKELILLEKSGEEEINISRCKFEVSNGKIDIKQQTPINKPENFETRTYGIEEVSIYVEFFAGFLSKNGNTADAHQRIDGRHSTDIRDTVFYTDAQMIEVARMSPNLVWVNPYNARNHGYSAPVPKDQSGAEKEQAAAEKAKQDKLEANIKAVEKKIQEACEPLVKQIFTGNMPDPLLEIENLPIELGDDMQEAKQKVDEFNTVRKELIREAFREAEAITTGGTVAKPINYGNGHWVLLAAKKTAANRIDIAYIDSMNWGIRDNGWQEIYIMCCEATKLANEVKAYYIEVKQQSDGATCGGLTMANALQLAELNVEWTQDSLKVAAARLKGKEAEIRTKHADFIQPKPCGTAEDVRNFNLFPDTLNPNLNRVYCYYDQRTKTLSISGCSLPDNLRGYTLLDPHNTDNKGIRITEDDEVEGERKLVLQLLKI
jgi:hypothetical protein